RCFLSAHFKKKGNVSLADICQRRIRKLESTLNVVCIKELACERQSFGGLRRGRRTRTWLGFSRIFVGHPYQKLFTEFDVATCHELKNLTAESEPWLDGTATAGLPSSRKVLV